ncbi:MAG: rhodanese-like domain-containing protein [Selenomonadaceae bacterium]|nr:rhodanese-like domain-containing protein [Selenomonadaceae bacterium]
MYKNLVTLTLMILVVTMIFTGCGNSYKHISQEEARKMMQTEQNYLIVDVRTKEEYNKKHIPGAVVVPIADIRDGKLDSLPDKNQKLFVYCWTGRRAEDASELLSSRGYQNVYEIGGLVDWTGEIEGEEVN